MNPEYQNTAFYSTEENIDRSFGLYDEGLLQIYKGYLVFKSKDSDITIEKDRIEKAEIVNKIPGAFEFILIIAANMLIIAGFLGFQFRNLFLLFLILCMANIILYYPLLREKWVRVVYLESGDTKTAFFRMSSPFEIFNTLLNGQKENQRILKKLK